MEFPGLGVDLLDQPFEDKFIRSIKRIPAKNPEDLQAGIPFFAGEFIAHDSSSRTISTGVARPKGLLASASEVVGGVQIDSEI